MPKPKQPKKTSPNLTESLNSFDAATLQAAVNTLEGSLGWEVFKSFIYYQAAAHGTMSNVLVQQTGREKEACAAGAKAEVLREVTDSFLDTLRNKIQGNEGVVEENIPQE